METRVSGKAYANILPKNIRQVGDMDLDKKIYIEDYAFSFIKENAPEEDEEGRVGILLGEIVDGATVGAEAGVEYMFVRGAMELTNASIFEGKITFTEETQSSLKSMKNLFFPNLKTVGWYLVSDSIKVQGNADVEKTHKDNFSDDSVLLYMNPAEESDAIFSCFDAGLEPLDGYAVFFEKNSEMQSYMAHHSYKKRSYTSTEEDAGRRFRQAASYSKYEGRVKKRLSITYGLAAVLAIFILIVGVGKMTRPASSSVGEPTVNYVNATVGVDATIAQVEDQTLNVEYASGNVDTTAAVETTTEEITTEQVTTEEVTTEEVTTEEVTTEPPTTEAEYEVYIVAQGDMLTNIVTRYYGSAERLKEVLEYNGITDGGNSINIGDEIKLPK